MHLEVLEDDQQTLSENSLMPQWLKIGNKQFSSCVSFATITEAPCVISKTKIIKVNLQGIRARLISIKALKWNSWRRHLGTVFKSQVYG